MYNYFDHAIIKGHKSPLHQWHLSVYAIKLYEFYAVISVFFHLFCHKNQQDFTSRRSARFFDNYEILKYRNKKQG